MDNLTSLKYVFAIEISWSAAPEEIILEFWIVGLGALSSSVCSSADSHLMLLLATRLPVKLVISVGEGKRGVGAETR